MAAGWPAFAVVLLACAAATLHSLPAGGASPQQSLYWCRKKECKCTSTESTDDNDQLQRVSVKCTFPGDENVILTSDSSNKNSNMFLVAVELKGNSRCKLIISGRTFSVYSRLRSFNVTGFAEVTVKPQGLHMKNENLNFTLTISHVQKLFLEVNAVPLQNCTVDVLIKNCQSVQLSNEIISKLRSFVFRGIGNLELSENTFKKAADPVIQRMILENVTANKLPSYAFVTTIDLLSITNCTFGTIERNAFPINSMVNMTLTNVTVDRIESEAFRNLSMITNLRIIGCRIREMENDAMMSVVQSIHIERSEFGSIRTSAVAVANELSLINNTFQLVARKGFMLHNLHSVRVVGNKFGRMEAETFFESTAAARQTWSVLRFSDNVFRQRWLPVVRLQQTAVETDVTGNQFVGSCGCDPWRFVAVSDHGDNGTMSADGVHDAGFADWNYCTADAAAAGCANLSATGAADMKFRIGEFMTAAGCDVDTAIYNRCVKDRLTGNGAAEGGFGFFEDTFTPAAERGIITTVVLLVLCGFGAVCAVSAVTWLNARGYFIKLRSLLTSGGAGEDGDRGGNDGLARTVSSHSISPISVRKYEEIQPHPMVVQMAPYKDGNAKTVVPEELTCEMLEELRDKLDDPEDYAEARIMIENLYDLIRVKERENWNAAGGLDDTTSSTITTRTGRSAGTNAPSPERSGPAPESNVDSTVTGPPKRYPWPQQPLPPVHYRPSSVVEYMDPADLLHGDGTGSDDGTDDVSIYCELADLRASVYDRPPHPKPSPPHPKPPPPQVKTRTTPPPIPIKPTEV